MEEQAWPPDPFPATFAKTLSDLEMPRFCRRYPALLTTLMKQMLDLVEVKRLSCINGDAAGSASTTCMPLYRRLTGWTKMPSWPGTQCRWHIPVSFEKLAKLGGVSSLPHDDLTKGSAFVRCPYAGRTLRLSGAPLPWRGRVAIFSERSSPRKAR